MTRSLASRRRLVTGSLAVAVSPAAFGLVFGLVAHQTGLSLVESVAMSALVMAGGAQFSALGLLSQGASTAVIVAVTAVVNLRNLLYATALAPWVEGLSLRRRAAMAHILADETFALSLDHFRRVGHVDANGYWITGVTSLSWVCATAVGFLAAGRVADPARFGLDAVFPAAMIGLAVLLADDGPARSAAAFAAIVAVGLGSILPLGVAVVAAALLGSAAIALAQRIGR